MSDTPGKVLSSLNATETRGESSSANGGVGCAAAFFHLLDRFHGRRLFPHKGLLPAERPKHRSKSHKEERLPMAKLLLIADENRGGFAVEDPVQQSERPEDEANIQKDEDEDEERAGIEKRSSRAPSVVARLMGLDSMPSPELPRPQQKQEETLTFPSLEERPLPPQTRKSRRKGGRVDEVTGKPSELHRKRLEKYPLALSRRRNVGRGRSYLLKTEDADAFAEPISSCSAAIISSASGRKASPLPSLQMDLAIRSILSPSKASRKLIASPIKSPLSAKSTALLFEAAAKLLEPNLQPSSRGRKEGTSTETAKKLPVDPENRNQKAGSCSTSANVGPRMKRGPPNLCRGPQTEHGLSKCHVSTDESPNIKIIDAIQQQRASKHVKDSKRELGFRRRGASVDDEELQGKALMNERFPNKNEHHMKMTVGDEKRTKPTRHKQEETSRRLSQPTSNMRSQKVKPPVSKQVREPSSQKSSHIALDSSRSTRASRNIQRGLSEPTTSCVSSNCVIDDVLSSNRHLEPCRKGSSVRIDKRSKEVDLVRRRGNPSIMRTLPRKTPLSGRQLPREVSEFVECDTASMETCSETVSLRAELSSELNYRSSDFDESSCSVADLEQSVSESTLNLMANSSELVAASSEGARASWKFLDRPASGMVNSESMKRVSLTSQSCCDMERLEDTASSSYLEGRDAVSYPGKTTAAILQELLVALNSSKARIRCDEMLEDKLEWPRVDSSAATLATSSASGECGQHDEVERVHACVSEYERTNNSPSVESAALVQNSRREERRVSMECKNPLSKGDAGLEECESTCDSMYTEECGQPSPISILESPFQDAASNTSDSFEAIQGRGSSEASGSEIPYSTSVRGSQAEEVIPLDRKMVIDCDKLLNTISRIHRIDPAVIGLDSRPTEAIDGEISSDKELTRAVSVSTEEAFARKLLLTGPFTDPELLDKLEERTQEMEWVISTSSASLCMEEDEVDSTSRSELGSSFRSHGHEAAAHSRKLILDCIDEALRLSLDGGRLPFGFCSDVLLPPSTTHLFGRVYRQVDDWKEMAIGMNLDDMVEKEMNTGAGRWCNFSSEVEDLMKDIESSLLKSLLEDLVRDVVSSSWWKVPSKKVGFSIKVPIKVGAAKSTFLGKF